MLKSDLASRLQREGFNAGVYSLDGDIPATLEGYMLKRSGRGWVIEYYERGETRLLGSHRTEEEACAHLYAILERDPTTRQRRP